MKIDLRLSLSWNERISSSLAFIFIMLLSLVLAYYTVKTAENIVDNPPQSIKAANLVNSE